MLFADCTANKTKIAITYSYRRSSVGRRLPAARDDSLRIGFSSRASSAARQFVRESPTADRTLNWYLLPPRGRVSGENLSEYGPERSDVRLYSATAHHTHKVTEFTGFWWSVSRKKSFNRNLYFTFGLLWFVKAASAKRDCTNTCSAYNIYRQPMEDSSPNAHAIRNSNRQAR